jgi:hypothetical protein
MLSKLIAKIPINWTKHAYCITMLMQRMVNDFAKSFDEISS